LSRRDAGMGWIHSQFVRNLASQISFSQRDTLIGVTDRT